MSSQSSGATEVRCRHCRQVVEEATAFCPSCGRDPLAEQAGRGADNGIYLMLVTANVLRLRRQWTLAEGKCSEVLRRDPENAAAHSLLGDIARDQGKLRDAIEWYKMALDRNPSSAADRKKLEAVIDRVFAERGRGVVGGAREALEQGLGKVAADVRGARPPCPAAVVLGVALGIILVTAVTAVLIGRGAAPPVAPAAQTAPSGGFAVVGPSEVSPAPEETATRGEEDLASLADGLPLLESQLLADMVGRAREIDPNCRVVSVEVDPEDGTARLRLSMPQVWVASATRGSIERVAVGLGAKAVASDRRISGVRVRCDMRPRAGSERLALMAVGSAADLAGAGERQDERVEDYYSFVWWDPEIRE